MSETIGQASAVELVKGLSAGTISSRELLERCLRRVEAANARINAVVALDLVRARQRADEADAAARRGESLGRLHGLPMTIKDSFDVPGMPCTAGAPKWRGNYPDKPAVAVQRLLDEGAVVFAKTNVPLMTADVQTYNRLHGTTNNPWNVRLTSGGSSGGAAAALATGMTPLELGSDIGGSIRIPAHFCGVFGHKASHGIISLRGHVPGLPGDVDEPELNVAGPMARTAEDLRLMLDVMAGTVPAMQPGWRLELPEARQTGLEQFKVLMWLDDPACPLDSQMVEVYRRLAATLAAAGVQVVVGSPMGLGLGDFYAPYATQVSSKMSSWSPRLQRRLMSATAPLLKGLGRFMSMPAHAERFYAGAGISHADWLASVAEGRRLRERFLAVFEHFDLILAPPTMTTAFPHDQSTPMGLRRLMVDGKRRHYADLFMWIAPATLMGLPATSAPVGQTGQGMPVNLQIIGAPYADRATIRFAELLSRVTGRLQSPGN